MASTFATNNLVTLRGRVHSTVVTGGGAGSFAHQLGHTPQAYWLAVIGNTTPYFTQTANSTYIYVTLSSGTAILYYVD